MKKWFFSIGIIILLIGVAVAANYNFSKLANSTRVIASKEDVWEISGDLQAGDNMRVTCYPGKNWDKPYFDPPDDYASVNHRHIWFEIVDPSGDITEYNTAWSGVDPYDASRTIAFSRIYVNVTIRGGGLEVEEQYPTYIGGMATLSGNYTVRVISEFEPAPMYDPEPPRYLAIGVPITVNVYPYTYFLPIGISISVVGTIIATWSARSTKRRKRSSR